MHRLRLRPGHLTLNELHDFFEDQACQVEVDPSAQRPIEESYQTVQRIVDNNQTVYGINTGFGLLAQKRISHDKLFQLQRNLVLSHAAGVGQLLDDAVVRLIILLKLNSLSRGFSGVRPVVLEYLLKFLQHSVVPCIPSQGSVGASGDLAPLAHLSCSLLGVGEVRVKESTIPASVALEKIGLEPLQLGPKEGLALLNGTQVSTALAIVGLLRTWKLFAAAMVAGAMTNDAAKGSDTPFDPRIHAVRLHPGQIDCATSYRRLLQGSAIRESHLSSESCDKVQDPYSLRCQPQVMGACLEQMRFVSGILEREANAVSDNPLVFAVEGEILSGGNFHAEPVAMAADSLALAIAEIGALAERRIALLMDQHLSGLPPFLVREGGLNSGFMIAQVTAAALASENKSLAHPASVDSLPTSANQEDHVSMATYAARRLNQMVINSMYIVGIELLAAAQGLDLRRPLISSPPLEFALAKIREAVPPYDVDRYMQPDLQRAMELIDSGFFLNPIFSLPNLGGQCAPHGQ
ncbi:MAG TPA: histidine ammonia-lyase [Pirellulaceae bacterium]|nr:histidine ammonia-lyase [Pirellulaceae bacterium]HMO90974.1 histidine ammonia-lyase [Pirellulaceae bacterium]HMP68089.1 histidine ammonia-lyase [Pirellulaceae bacterium]